MTNQTLRSLAKDYANGILNKEAYRKARNELLSGVLSGEIPLEVNEYRAPLPAQDLDSTFEKTAIKPPDSSQAVPPQKDEEPITEFVTRPQKRKPSFAGESPDSPLKNYFGLITAAIILCIIALIVLMLAIEEYIQPTKQTNVTDSEQGLTSPAQQNKSANELIEEFLLQHNWSDESLQQFTTQWNSLDPVEQTNALMSPLSIQLTNAIYKQLLEERALFGTGDNDAIITRQHALVNFANGVGIDDPRLKVREAEPEIITPPVDVSIETIDSMGIEPDLQD